MFAKVVTDIGAFCPYHIIEARHISWQDFDEDDAQSVPDMYRIDDIGLYSSYEKVRLLLSLDDTYLFLEKGVVYIMNNDGKTIDTIHV